MRIVVLGAGGIGGSIGARLHQSGHDVALVARGAHGEAIRERGLTFATPEERVTLRIPVYADPGAVAWTPDDVVVLAVKSQDTESAARALVAAAGPEVPVVAAQNGVANERDAGPLVRPRPRDVRDDADRAPRARRGHRPLGGGDRDPRPRSLPDGVDEVDEALAAALRDSRCESVARPDIMRWKYRKLLNNLGNAVRGAVRPRAGRRGRAVRARAARGRGRGCLRGRRDRPGRARPRTTNVGATISARAGRGCHPRRRLDLAEPGPRVRRRDRLPQRRDRAARPAVRRTDAGERADPDPDGRGRGASGRAGRDDARGAAGGAARLTSAAGTESQASAPPSTLRRPTDPPWAAGDGTPRSRARARRPSTPGCARSAPSPWASRSRRKARTRSATTTSTAVVVRARLEPYVATTVLERVADQVGEGLGQPAAVHRTPPTPSATSQPAPGGANAGAKRAPTSAKRSASGDVLAMERAALRRPTGRGAAGPRSAVADGRPPPPPSGWPPPARTPGVGGGPRAPAGCAAAPAGSVARGSHARRRHVPAPASARPAPAAR